MASTSFMNLKTLDQHFQNNLGLDTQNQFVIQKCDQNKNVLCVQVENKNSRSKRKFIFTKVLNHTDLNEKKIDHSKLLENVCVVQYEKDAYFGFENKDIKSPVKNNLDNLKTILKHLAEFQATRLGKGNIKKLEVKQIVDDVTDLPYFKDLDKTNVTDYIIRLQKSVEKLSKDCFVVKSISNIQASNVYITPSNKVVFLDLENEVFQSPVYDALKYIFALSDEKFRQHYLKTLLNDYYQNLSQFVQKSNRSISEILNLNVFESHVKIYMSIVKFKLLLYLTQANNEQQDLDNLCKNVSYCLKYQIISYEDCLEAISKKIGSTEFQLIDYKLVPVDEKHGHLGNYFNLTLKINHFDKFVEDILFVKSLVTDNDHLNSVVQADPCKKEQFFYRNLMPLFKQYGLGSLLDFATECYFDRLNDVMILKNLAVSDYKPFRPNDRIGYDILKIAYHKLAKYHACSILLEERMSKEKGAAVRLGEIYKEFMIDWLFEVPEGGSDLPVCLNNAKPGIEALIDHFEDVSKKSTKEEFLRKVNEFYPVFLERVNKPSKRFRNVVCHGDLYASNLLVKCDQKGVPEDCVIIDFQGLRYAPITQDVLMLAYFSAHKEIRDEYLDQLLQEYYLELKNNLSKYNFDINSIYTFEEFIECVNLIRPAALVASLCYSQIMAMPYDKMKEIFFNKEKFDILLGNRKEFIKYLITFTGDCTRFLKGLLEDLHDILC